MKIISHRGNIAGPVPEKENSPWHINMALYLGFDVEVDIWNINGKWYLGHDKPEYFVDTQWLIARKDKLWFHCKNLDAAYELSKANGSFKFFCHTQDPFCPVVLGYLWVHDLECELRDNCIIPLMTKEDINDFDLTENVFGVCTDYPFEARNEL